MIFICVTKVNLLDCENFHQNFVYHFFLIKIYIQKYYKIYINTYMLSTKESLESRQEYFITNKKRNDIITLLLKYLTGQK